MSEELLRMILQKLEVLRNFLIVADEGVRQQQSAMNDEVIAVMKDIRSDLGKAIKQAQK